MTLFDSDDRLPGAGPTDRALAVLRAALGAIPVVGPAAVEMLAGIVIPPLVRQQVDFINDLADRVRRLERERGIEVVNFHDNPKFIEAIGTALRLASFTSQQEKRKALRNAVLNSAIIGGSDIIEQQLFLGFIERFTELHLQMLKLLQNPSKWLSGAPRPASGSGGATVLRSILLAGLPQLKSREFLADQLWAEFLSLHLTTGAASLDNWGEGPSVTRKRTTDFGDRFLEFIASPITE